MIFLVQPKFAYFAVLGLLEMMITLSFSVSSELQSQSLEAKFPCVLWKKIILATSDIHYVFYEKHEINFYVKGWGHSKLP